ncbi:EAL domain-containing protein [Tolypothrix bouteillei VB521301]|uniref:Diguanylate cyclase n=1 Tax=Tolypothrix bouteillei VB521301 TaxID=1479485 RepID=A0A0C1QWG0_9CYAN|nr:EAL domain-containing protein [Tolypothrix bouteillei VB521301]
MIAQFTKKLSSLLSVLNSYCQHKAIATLSVQQSVLAASILMAGLVLAARYTGGLQFLELLAFDQMVRLESNSEPDERLLVVAITEADIEKLKKWPISDQILAQALKNLQQYKPRAIGIDLYRNISVPPGENALLQQLRLPNVLSIYELGGVDAEKVPSIRGVPPEQTGFNDLLLDPDGVIRRNLMYAYEGEKKYYSFSLRLSLKYLAQQNVAFKTLPDGLQLGNTTFPALNTHSGGYHNLDDAGYQVLVSYGSIDVARQVTLTQVLRKEINPNLVKDKVVLIGTTAPSLKDIFFTPYNAGQSAKPRTPGVFLHAQFVSQILSTALDRKPLVWFWSEWEEILWIFLWALVGGALACRLRHPLLLGVVGVVSWAGLCGICFYIFLHGGWIPFVPASLTLITTGVSTFCYVLLRRSLHDPLTDLPNRDCFLKSLEVAISNSQLHQNTRFAVLFLNLDRFKIINESLGYQVGDQLLKNTAQRLKAGVRSRGTVARVGGDEFAILLLNISHTSEATQLADELQQQISQPFQKDGQQIFTSISIGIAFNQSELNYHPVELLRDAHIAMYRAKDLGKARHQVFATGMHTQVIKRFQLEADLRRGIELEELYLVYQPIVSLITEKIAGFEALVRWNHPKHGFVSPLEFISVAEETGLIIPLGKWIFQAACRQLSIWQAQFPASPPLMMSINLSGQQFTQPDLVEYIEQSLQETGLDGRSVKLEITESVAMNDVEAAISVMLRLRNLNLRLSIDDFGTGYSSLSYLHRFPVNTLKIDRSFVSRMEDTDEDAAIVQTIVMLSHSLGMDIVAEGVETVEQKAKLQALNCEYGQGYFFSKPVDSKTATALLQSQFSTTGSYLVEEQHKIPQA